jgi:hypothetical protein
MNNNYNKLNQFFIRIYEFLILVMPVKIKRGDFANTQIANYTISFAKPYQIIVVFKETAQKFVCGAFTIDHIR